MKLIFKQIWVVLIFILLATGLYAQCGCTNCPQFLPDNGSADFFINVNGADNNDLATNNSVVGISMEFDHEYLGDLTIVLTSPGGQTVSLVGPSGFHGGTSGSIWNISFVESTATAVPDAGFSSTFDSNQSWGTGNSYTGSYYPNVGDLEDFNMGSINGTWTFSVVDNQGADTGNFIDFGLSFADESSSTNPSGMIGCTSNPPCMLVGVPMLTVGTCENQGTEDPADDTFTIEVSNLDFTDNSSADVTFDGSLMTMTVANTYEITLPANGNILPAVVAVGDGSGTCTVDFTDVNSPMQCSPVACDADPGTFTTNLAANNLICNAANSGLSVIDIITNNDFNASPTNPCGVPDVAPGVVYLLYSDAPTVEDFTADPNFITILGTAPLGDPNMIIQGITVGGITFGDPASNNNTFFIGIGYAFDEDDGTGAVTTSIDYDCSSGVDLCGPLASLTEFVPFTIMDPITINNVVRTCNADNTLRFEFDITGGVPGFNAATGNDPFGDVLFSITNNGAGILSTTTSSNGQTVILDNVNGNFDLSIVDANSCSPNNFSGVYMLPTLDLITFPTKLCALDEDCISANSELIIGDITPPLGRFIIDLTTDDFPQESVVNIRNSSGIVVFSIIGVNGTFTYNETTPFLDPNDTYTFEIIDSFGDGYSCLTGATPTVSIFDEETGALVFSDDFSTWNSGTCGSGSTPNGNDMLFGPFSIGSPNADPDGPTGLISGPGVSDNLDNTATFNSFVAGPGVHTINYDFTDPNGCVLHDEETVTVCANPMTPSVEATNPGAVCPGADVMLSVVDLSVAGPDADPTTADIAIYEWYEDDGTGMPDLVVGILSTTATLNIGDPDLLFDYSNGTPETYDLLVRAVTHTVDGATCFSCFTAVIVSKDLTCCMIMINSIDTMEPSCPLEADGSITINATSGNPIQYSIDGGATFSPINNYTGLTGGSYNIVVEEVANSTCFATQQVTLTPALDITPPVAMCQDLTVTLDANGMAGITVSDVDNGSTDECGIASMTLDMMDFTCTDVGDNTVTLTVTDNSGLSSTCTATVTVNEIAPVAMCQDLTVMLDANGMASITVSDVDNGSTDECGIASMTLDMMDFTCTDVGDNTVTLTVTDNSGLSSTCTATVTVNEVAPVAMCQDLTVMLDANGMASIAVSDVDNGSTDECGIASMTLDMMDFTCTDVGDNTVTLTVTDNSGLSSTCTATVTVNEIAPVAMCQDLTVTLDANGMASIAVSDVDNGSTDECGIASMTLDMMDFTCTDVGDNTVTLTVTDNSGLSSTCTATVTVNEVAPVAMCQDLTVMLDANGMASITVSDVDNGSTDECGIASMTLDMMDFTCTDVGDNTVTLTVTDNSGLSSTCTATVTVNEVAPVAMCQDLTVMLDANGMASIAVSDVDNGSTDECGIASMTLDMMDFTCTDVGDNTVTLTVTDNSGLSSTCTATVTVNEVAPVAMCQDLTVTLDANGMASIAVSDVDNGSTDECGIASMTLDMMDFTCTDVGDNTVTLTVTDNSGLSSTCTATVTVNEVAPVAMCQDLTVTLDANGMASITVSDVDNGSTDECGIASMTLDMMDFTCTDVGDNTVTLTVTDNSGLSSTCTATVTVNEVAPVAMCQDLTVMLDANGMASIAVSDVDNGSTDECGIASMTLDMMDFTCTDVGDNTVTLTVTDNSGLSSTCTATVTVNEVAPVAMCQDLTVTLDANGMASITVSDVDNGSTDECGIASMTLDMMDFTCTDVGDNTVTLTVTDNSGLSSTCTATVTVNEVAPVAMCQDLTVMLDANGMASITVSDVDNGSTDECGIASMTLDMMDFTCTDVGDNTVTLTVTDNSGLSSTCTANVNIFDNIPPSVVCRPPIQTKTDPNQCGKVIEINPPYVEDACNFTMSHDGPDDDFFAPGEYEVIWTIMDESGNVANCIQFIQVLDLVLPEINSCNTHTDFDYDGDCMASVSIQMDANDNCGIASISNLGTFQYPIGNAFLHEIEVTDIYGNVNTHTVTVYTHDELAPLAEVCPENVQLGTDTGVLLNSELPSPVFIDNCTITSITNDAPEALEIGTSTVTWSAMDIYGNVGTCTYDVEVFQNGVQILNLVSELKSCAPEESDVAIVDWNKPDLFTNKCPTCEEVVYPDFKYLGYLYGHQYFIYVGNQEYTWEQAQTYAEDTMSGNLVTIDDVLENNYIARAIHDHETNYWIGLSLSTNEEGNHTFNWTDYSQSEANYSNFEYELDLQSNSSLHATLQPDGNWDTALGNQSHRFIVERPCINIEQIGPYYYYEQIGGGMDSVLLSQGGIWPMGNSYITYKGEDMCGNVAIETMDIQVGGQQVEYCEIFTALQYPLIKKVSIDGDVVSNQQIHADIDGYTDLSEQTINLFNYVEDSSLPLNEQEVNWTLEPSTDYNKTFWSVYMDKNQDGDFFDEGELLYKASGFEAHTVTLSADQFMATSCRMRILATWFDYAEPCSGHILGEAEDFEVAYYFNQIPEIGDDNIQSQGLDDSSISIVPNPADDIVEIYTPRFETEAKMTIVNLEGKTVRLTSLSSLTIRHQINVSDLLPGIYILNIDHQNHSVKKRLIIH